MTAYSHAAAVQKIKSKKEGKANKPNASKPRLYAKGTFLGFRRCVCLRACGIIVIFARACQRVGRNATIYFRAAILRM